jgi:serine/threonine protein kinase
MAQNLKSDESPRPGAAFQEGSVVAGYRLVERLGEGGMGVVFAALDMALGRRVALKTLRPDLAANAELRQRLVREAQITAQLEHDNIVRLYHVGEAAGQLFLVMEMLAGQSLRQRLRQSAKMPLADAMRIARDVARGLAAAHERDLIHRDVTPNNIWLEPSGRAKLLDFGLARAAYGIATISHSGAVLGTPGFMAPEQAAGEAPDARTDVFALGCVLYLLTTGNKPFTGANPSPQAAISAVLKQAPVSPRERNPEIPAALDGLIQRMLAKKPDNRPSTAMVVADALDSMLSSPPAVMLNPQRTKTFAPKTAPARDRAVPKSRRRLTIFIALLALLVVGVAAIVLVIKLGPHRDNKSPSPPGSDEAKTSFPPLDSDWKDTFATTPRDKLADELTAEFRRRNTGFHGDVLMQFGDRGVVDGISIQSDAVFDLTPIQAVPGLAGLWCKGSRPRAGSLEDLTPLAGLGLSSLDVSNTRVHNLSAVRTLRPHDAIYYLCVAGTRVESLEPLRDVRLQVFDLRDTPVKNLEPLTKSSIQSISFDWPDGPDPAPLKDCKTIAEINGGSAEDFWKKTGR